MKSGLRARMVSASRQSLRLVSPMSELVSGVKQWGVIRFVESVTNEEFRPMSVRVARDTSVESKMKKTQLVVESMCDNILSRFFLHL